MGLAVGGPFVVDLDQHGADQALSAPVPIAAARAAAKLAVPLDPCTCLADRKGRMIEALDRLAKAAGARANPGGSIVDGVLRTGA
ncbi:MAG: hypothetical protein JKP98_13425 [Rhodobacteraceae bacterium]|nr:hypothetical protein [Paracoccaceae bacterium]